MTVNLNVFSPLMKDKIWTNMKSNLIVTYECNLITILSNSLSQTSSQVAEAMALYSASALDLATTLYFLLSQ